MVKRTFYLEKKRNILQMKMIDKLAHNSLEAIVSFKGKCFEVGEITLIRYRKDLEHKYHTEEKEMEHKQPCTVIGLQVNDKRMSFALTTLCKSHYKKIDYGLILSAEN